MLHLKVGGELWKIDVKCVKKMLYAFKKIFLYKNEMLRNNMTGLEIQRANLVAVFKKGEMEKW